jgi:hypothetical protein
MRVGTLLITLTSSLNHTRHTFGGIQHEYFPDIVPELNDTTDTESVAHFDSTFVTFDNKL